MTDELEVMKQLRVDEKTQLEALRAPAAAAGLNWGNILKVILEYGPTAIAILQKILGGTTAPVTPPAVQPK
jgi:hypothetical protein